MGGAVFDADPARRETSFRVGRVMMADSTSGASIDYEEMRTNPGWIPAAGWHLHPGNDLVNGAFTDVDYESAYAVQQQYSGFRSYVTLATNYPRGSGFKWDHALRRTAEERARSTPGFLTSNWTILKLPDRLVAPESMTIMSGQEDVFALEETRNRVPTRTNHYGILVTEAANARPRPYIDVWTLSDRFAGRDIGIQATQRGNVTVNGVAQTLVIYPVLVPGTPIDGRYYDQARRITRPRTGN